MEEITNCINCGAPLKYGENEYENLAKCSYCGTEYHIDRLGKIEEYKVNLMINGEIHKFYLSEFKLHHISGDCYRDLNGRLVTNKVKEKREITMIEY